MQHLGEQPHHVTIELSNPQCKGLRTLQSLGAKECTLTDIRSLPDGRTRHFVRIPAGVEPTVGVFSNVRAATRLGREAWFDSDGCDVCRTILSEGSFLVSGRHLGDQTIIYSFVVPSSDGFGHIVSTLEARGLKPKILEVRRFQARKGVLSAKQERVLWIALKTGFFSYPRKMDSIELSRRLGIMPSTLSEIMRRGTRRLLEHYFEEDARESHHK